MLILARILCILGGYCFGLIQTSYIYGRLHGIDIRQYGSGNAGTTNALRVLGKKAGAIVFVGDVLKSVAACTLAHLACYGLDIANPYLYVIYTAAGVVLGHNFPFYMQFRGGKGIAATAGIAIGLLDWRIALVELLTFAISVIITKYVSVGSIVLVLGLAISYIFLVYHDNAKYGFVSDAKRIESCIVMSCISLLAIYRHRANIRRLMDGTENKLSFKAKAEVE